MTPRVWLLSAASRWGLPSAGAADAGEPCTAGRAATELEGGEGVWGVDAAATLGWACSAASCWALPSLPGNAATGPPVGEAGTAGAWDGDACGEVGAVELAGAEGVGVKVAAGSPW